MSQSAEPMLLDHNYDGIQEYDNPTPGWWWMLFHATVVFSIVYFLFFQFSPDSWTLKDAYNASVVVDLRKQFAEIGELKADEATIVKYSTDKKWLEVGRNTFATNCVSCHGRDGEGVVGPNMTDDAYKNVKTITDIATVITNGAANGAMPAWKNRLHPNEVVLTASYIASLRGKNLPSARPVEGDVIPPWPKGN
ncbi:MAG: c-type cytochrome [Phycisphaerales bacterium]|nr:c-type cytochrome [Phycisphaerales bacterium]